MKGAGGGRRPASECGGEGVSGKGGGGAKKKDTVSAHIARLVRNAPTLRRKNFFRRHKPELFVLWRLLYVMLVYFLPRCEAQTELSAGTASTSVATHRWVAHTPACLAGFA